MDWKFPTEADLAAMRPKPKLRSEGECSIRDDEAMEKLRGTVYDSAFGVALRPAVVWWDRINRSKGGSYDQRRKAIYDRIRFTDFFGFPRQGVLREAWVRKTITEAADQADLSFFKQFGKALKQRPSSKVSPAYDELDVFLVTGWVDALHGLPELCSVSKSGLLSIVLHRFPNLNGPDHLLDEGALTQRCYRKLELPSYSGKKFRVREVGEKLQFVAPNGAVFVYPAPESRARSHPEYHWPIGQNSLHALAALPRGQQHFWLFLLHILARYHRKKAHFDKKRRPRTP